MTKLVLSSLALTWALPALAASPTSPKKVDYNQIGRAHV